MKYRDKLDALALDKYVAWMNARAKAAGAKGLLSACLLRDRILESAGRCEWCDADVVGKDFELDHIISIKQGGSNQPGNLVVACPNCNRRKARKHPAVFAAEIASESGKRTKLVARILAAGGVEAGLQLAMFGRAGETVAEEAKDGDDSLVSPYDWTE